MGQKKGLIYNAFVLGFLFVIWYFTTSKPGYSPLPIQTPKECYSTLDLTPTDLTLVVCSASEVSVPVPAEVLLSVERVVNAFSQYWDLTLKFKYQVSASPQKIRNSSQSVKRVKSLVFFVGENPVEYPEDHIISLPLSQVADIPFYLIGYLRSLSSMGKTNEALINGLTEPEHGKVEVMLNEWLDSQIYKQALAFNQLITHNDPKVSKTQYESLEAIREKIHSQATTPEKISVWKALSSLNSDPSLSKSPHFQWDFKLGVYAPIFFPVIFPICGAIYSRLFLRK